MDRENYKIVYKREFEKKFRNLIKKNKSLADRIAQSIYNLQKNPYAGKQLYYNLAGYWSLRIGKYRVIYEIDENTKEVILVTVGHRKHIYS